MKKDQLLKYTAEQLRERCAKELCGTNAKYTRDSIIEQVNYHIGKADEYTTDIKVTLYNELLDGTKEIRKAKKELKKAGFDVKVRYLDLSTVIEVSWLKDIKPKTVADVFNIAFPYICGVLVASAFLYGIYLIITGVASTVN
ncbi:hypothetical protein BSP36_016 [Bacillus phage BSP36]|uniref:Uncharacterized protein n=1 Tax=Bacillus phage BSP38 TaxID=2283013 RepID=A0A345MJM8_BPBSP|nr:hypothetical protein HWB82_gp018 [Bacillus phage BSP38]AXH71060.1 hypothetical protein BSP38_018 [Bacillus phage BSP38]AYJ75103.1 hypothetical protein BSP36_016 [Bacillus phage BSP36]